MPYKTDKISIKDPFLDKRTKLIPCQKEMVLFWHDRGESQRDLAKRFKVSRRLIQFILDPEKQKKNYQDRVESGGSKQYYNREKHTDAIRKHRRYKYETLKNSV